MEQSASEDDCDSPRTRAARRQAKMTKETENSVYEAEGNYAATSFKHGGTAVKKGPNREIYVMGQDGEYIQVDKNGQPILKTQFGGKKSKDGNFAPDGHFAPDGTWIAAKDSSGKVKKYDADGKEYYESIPGHAQKVSYKRFAYQTREDKDSGICDNPSYNGRPRDPNGNPIHHGPKSIKNPDGTYTEQK